MVTGTLCEDFDRFIEAEWSNELSLLGLSWTAGAGSGLETKPSSYPLNCRGYPPVSSDWYTEKNVTSRRAKRPFATLSRCFDSP